MSQKRLNPSNVPKEYKDDDALYVCVAHQNVRLNIDPKNPAYVNDSTEDESGKKFTFKLAHLRPFERWYMCVSKGAIMLHGEWLKTDEGKAEVEAAKKGNGGK